MDEFVANQLTSVGLEKYIELFNIKGIDESIYIGLDLPTLMSFLPEDLEGVGKIYRNICLLSVSSASTTTTTTNNNLNHNNSNVQIKQEPIQYETCIFGDDEVRMIHIVPSNNKFNLTYLPYSIKQEQEEEDAGYDSGRSRLRSSIEVNGYEWKLDKEDSESDNDSTCTIPTARTRADTNGALHKNKTSTRTITDETNDNGSINGINGIEGGESDTQLETVNDNNDNDDGMLVEKRSLRKRKESPVFYGQSKKSTKLLKINATKSLHDITSLKISLEYVKIVTKTSGETKIQISMERNRFKPSLPISELINYNSKYEKLKIKFKFQNMIHLNSFIAFLRSNARGLNHVIGLKFVAATQKRSKCIIMDEQIYSLGFLPDAFLSRLTSLVFQCGFSYKLNPIIFSYLLSKCESLEEFEATRGLICTGVENDDDYYRFQTFKIPALPKLTTFSWAYEYNVILGHGVAQQPSIIELEEPENSEPKTTTHGLSNCIKFQIDFSNASYNALQQLYLGLQIEPKFKSSAQFPNLKIFNVLGPWNKNKDIFMQPSNNADDAGVVDPPIQCSSSSSSSSSSLILPTSNINCINELCLPLGLTSTTTTNIQFINNLPTNFPRLTKLHVDFPTVESLQHLITTMAKQQQLQLRQLNLSINYDFIQSALICALTGLPYTLQNLVERDKAKLVNLKKYEYWEGFSKHLHIQIPTTTTTTDENVEETPIDEIGNIGIGSIKSLKEIIINNFPRTIHIPENQVHFSNPDGDLSKEPWISSFDLVHNTFPETILLKEFGKLKGSLEVVELVRFHVPEQVKSDFKELMGFPLTVESKIKRGKGIDCFQDRTLTMVTPKEEKE